MNSVAIELLYHLPKVDKRLEEPRLARLLVEYPRALVKEAGYYQATWNASNVPSGIYFYCLQVGEFVETKKMTLIK